MLTSLAFVKQLATRLYVPKSSLKGGKYLNICDFFFLVLNQIRVLNEVTPNPDDDAALKVTTRWLESIMRPGVEASSRLLMGCETCDLSFLATCTDLLALQSSFEEHTSSCRAFPIRGRKCSRVS
jgi:hypothetical protein